MKFSTLLLASSVLAAPAFAQTSDHAQRDRSSRNPVHGETVEEVVISAPGVEQVPGVSATSFSPGASRPVLRGFQGERVRVLTDGLGTLDVSNTSTDHAVSIEPLTAERIEVLRGPAVLLFGSQAIGGAVNVLDRRIAPSMRSRTGIWKKPRNRSRSPTNADACPTAVRAPTRWAVASR